MPIKKENKDRYPKDWPEIRKQILERAKNRCERCKLPNYAVGHREESGRFIPIRGNIHADCAGNGQSYPSMEPLTYAEAREWADMSNSWAPDERLIVIVLTIAHIHDESPENCDPSNLLALCQRCHNRHDAASRAKRRKEKKNKPQTMRLPTMDGDEDTNGNV